MLHLGSITYAVYLLAFTVPLALVLGGLVARIYGRAGLRATLVPALVVTTWLTFADHWAIADGIWRFDDSRILGVHLGTVPIEEAAFFLMTNLLVAFGVALLRRV